MEYTVLYSKRKTITLSLRGGVLTVKAPIGTDKGKIESLIAQHSRWINTHLKEAAERAELENRLDEEKIKELKKEARLYFKEKTEYYARIMGVEYKKIRISSAKTRFGS
ncbi:MAG: DUF45 domain-containing protein, partial [Firmicutes bacterium]|nr:DUF45 domain-containing protein [Bacillota bacterium]